MEIKKIHEAVKQLNNELPVIAFTQKLWANQVEKFSKEYFGQLAGKMLVTPLKGIFADFRILTPLPQVVYRELEDINVEKYRVEFTLKTNLNPSDDSSYISRHTIDFEFIRFCISAKDGNAYLEKVEEKYLALPPVLSSDVDRNGHFQYLIDNEQYKESQIKYFVEWQEMSAGFLVANGLLESFNKPFKIIDFITMFPKLSFTGDFRIKTIEVDSESLLCFVPSEFELKEPTQCELEAQRDRTFGTGAYENGEFSVGGGTYTSATLGDRPNPSSSNKSEMYLFLPKSASEKLFKPATENKSQHVIAKSSDNWEIPPFLMTHKATITIEDQLSISWEQNNPIINIKLGFYLDFYLKIWIKVFRIKTHLGTADSKNQYLIDYSGKLIELYNGDLGFVGELYDPTNFRIRDLYLDTILPDSIDRVASKVLKYILEPIVRYFITKLVITVTWPLISKYILFGLGGSGLVDEDGKHPNQVPVIKLSNYYSDNESVSIGITRTFKNIEK